MRHRDFVEALRIARESHGTANLTQVIDMKPCPLTVNPSYIISVEYLPID